VDECLAETVAKNAKGRETESYLADRATKLGSGRLLGWDFSFDESKFITGM